MTFSTGWTAVSMLTVKKLSWVSDKSKHTGRLFDCKIYRPCVSVWAWRQLWCLWWTLLYFAQFSQEVVGNERNLGSHKNARGPPSSGSNVENVGYIPDILGDVLPRSRAGSWSTSSETWRYVGLKPSSSVGCQQSWCKSIILLIGFIR